MNKNPDGAPARTASTTGVVAPHNKPPPDKDNKKGPITAPASPASDHSPNRYEDQDLSESFDYAAHRHVEKPTNMIESTGHLIKGCLGGGILGIHEAYMKCGLWTALCSTAIFGVYITYCIWILVKSAEILYKRLHLTSMSYPDLAEASVLASGMPSIKKFAKCFRYAVDIIVCIDLFGSCCVYEIIIAKTILQVSEGEGEADNLKMIRVYVAALLVPIILLCMITTLKYLARFTLLADFFIVLTVIATIGYGLDVAPPIGSVPAFKTLLGFFEFNGVVVFSMEGVGVSLPIENHMKNPKDFPKVLIAGMTIVVSFVMTVGFFGYWGFGEKCISPVTLNFPHAVLPTILKCLMGIMIYITFALNFWAPFNLCWHYLQKRHPPEKYWIWERVYRTIFIIMITIIALIFPNIGNLMGLLGAFCLSNMGFVFPAIIETLVMWKRPGLGRFKWILVKNIVISILGIVLFIAGSLSNIHGLVKSFTI